MHTVFRIADVSIDTVSRIPVDAGWACAAVDDEKVEDVKAKRISADEIWSSTDAKKKNLKTANAAPAGAGDTSTWTARDSDSKLILSWPVGGRHIKYAMIFMGDIANRIAGRILAFPRN